MGFGDMVRLTLNSDAKRYIRCLALCNVVGFVYYLLMVAMVTCLVTREVLPRAYGEQTTLYYTLQGVSAWLLVNTLGNFTLLYTTNSSINTQKNSGSTKHKGKIYKLLSKRLPGTMFCKKCSSEVPARSHHCSLCDICILGRDHHCFFVSQCIGETNQKYFIIFCLYQIISGFYVTVLFAKYLSVVYGVRFTSVFSLLRVLPDLVTAWWCSEAVTPTSGPVTHYLMYVVTLLYAALFSALFAAGFFSWQIYLVSNGQTTHEARAGIHPGGTHTTWQNYKSTFGTGRLLMWIFPVDLIPILKPS